MCKSDAIKIEKKFKEELFGKLHESCEIVRASNINVSEINEFIDHMGDAYEGIKLYFISFEINKCNFFMKL